MRSYGCDPEVVGGGGGPAPLVSRAGRRTQASPRGARLTGGEASGRRILTVTGADLRASSGVLRAGLFNILGVDLSGLRVIDLFAGAGSLGLEALSRGAEQVTFVEVQSARARVISANCETLGFSDRARVLARDALAFVSEQPPALLEARLVLLDPPYLDPGPDLCLRTVAKLGGVAARHPEWDPLVVVEHHRRLPLPEDSGALHCVREVRYGSSLLTFYRRPS